MPTSKDFFNKFRDEDTCKSYWKQIRDQEGVVCKKCFHHEHYWHKNLWQYECKRCKFRTTLRSGTVMEGSKLPYSYWLTAMAFLTSTKKSISALQLQKELGHKRYEPIWAMLHKIRLAMRHRDTKYELKEYIEMDEGFFKISDKNGLKKTKDGQQGRGSSRKVPVLVSVESKEVMGQTPNPHKPNRKVKRMKMTVMDSLTSKDINRETSKWIDQESTVMTDGYRGYCKLHEVARRHKVVVVKDKTKIDKVFPWTHIAISNAKRLLLGIHHSIKSIYMQNYLDEYCYKFNRRYFGDKLFDRLLVASVSSTWYNNMYKSG